jgi:ureidoglycolate hydrolase
MKIQNVTDSAFVTYGRVVDGYDYAKLLEVLETTTDAPADAVIYVPSDAALEATDAMKDLQVNCYGGMPIQIGYCNGTNSKLNCLEYHRDSEINVAADDIILLLATMTDVVDGKIDSTKVQAFYAKKGTAVELYATTLHYAPCSAKRGEHFRVAIVLPKGTNLEKPEITVKNAEDSRLFAANKWLIAHPETSEAKQGAYVGITGANIELA